MICSKSKKSPVDSQPFNVNVYRFLSAINRRCSILLQTIQSYLSYFSNNGEKGQIFQSCTPVRDDPQFCIQLANKPLCQSDAQGSHCRNRSCSVEELLLQGSLLAPGMEIPPNQAKQVVIIFNAKYV